MFGCYVVIATIGKLTGYIAVLWYLRGATPRSRRGFWRRVQGLTLFDIVCGRYMNVDLSYPARAIILVILSMFHIKVLRSSYFQFWGSIHEETRHTGERSH